MCSERNPYERHLPTVQVARYGYGGGGQLTILDIKTRRKRDTRLRRKVDTTIETYRLRYILLITRRTVIHIGDTVAYDIVETDVPRYQPYRYTRSIRGYSARCAYQ